MATQNSYSFIYTTDKLLPFIAARLCLLVIKCNVLQTAPETQAVYPLQIQNAGSSSSTVPPAHHHQCPSVALCIPGRIHSCLCLRAVPSSSGFCLEFLCIPFPSSSVACPGGQDPSWSPGHGAQPLSISAIHVLRAPHPCRCLVCSAVPLHQ